MRNKKVIEPFKILEARLKFKVTWIFGHVPTYSNLKFPFEAHRLFHTLHFCSSQLALPFSIPFYLFQIIEYTQNSSHEPQKCPPLRNHNFKFTDRGNQAEFKNDPTVRNKLFRLTLRLNFAKPQKSSGAARLSKGPRWCFFRGTDAFWWNAC